MSDVCPKCGETALSTELERTCQNCGFVAVGASLLVQDKVTWVANEHCSSGYGSAPKTHLNRHLFQSIAKGRLQGKKLITRVGLRLSSNSRIVDDAKSLYDRVYDHGNFHNRRLKIKAVLAAACFYIVCRQFGWTVTLHDISEVAQCSAFALDRCKREVLETFGLEIKSVDLLALAEARCEKANLDKGVTLLMVKVIKLSQRLWLSEGRKPENIVSASCFVAWQGEEPARRLKTNFRAFCRLCKFSFSSQAGILVGLIQGVLCELAKQIPWVSAERVEPSRVALHLKDIVEFQNTLIAESAAHQSCDDDSDADISDEDVASTDESDMNRQCRRDGRTQSTNLNLDNEELGSDDIPDDQLNQYIRTKAEIQELQSYL